MAYIDDEISDIDGQPNELYKFDGAFQSYYYTTGPKTISFAGNDYIPATLERSEISAGTQEDDGLAINIEMPISLDLVQQYAFQIAPPSLRLTIYRYHNIAEWVPYWNGIVGQIKVNDGRASLRSPSIIETVLNGSFPNVYYQTICNHRLFDERCGIDEADWDQVATVAAIIGRSVELSTIGTLDGQLIGGTARLANGEERMIVAQTGNIITVNYPYSSINLADTMTIIAGCDHARDGDCINRYANGINFGGFLYIPPENVFEQGIEPGRVPIADETCLPTIPTFEGWYLMFRHLIYRPDGAALASSNRGTTALNVGGGLADFNNTTSCKAFGSGTFSQCSRGTAAEGEIWKEYRYDYDVLAAASGASLHLQHQYPFNVHETGVRMKFQYRRWFDAGWTTILGATGDGVDATTAVDGSVDLDDLFPRDNFWTVPF